MNVERLSKQGLQKILRGHVKEPVTCVIKFYSNGCPMCHNLKDYYEDIANSYDDLYFFAFDIKDYPQIETILNFNGVPTISLVKVGDSAPKIRVLEDPENPNEKTWYRTSDITKFIEKEK